MLLYTLQPLPIGLVISLDTRVMQVAAAAGAGEGAAAADLAPPPAFAAAADLQRTKHNLIERGTSFTPIVSLMRKCIPTLSY